MASPFHILDVFTNERFSGNPLAVVLEADEFDTRQCQAVAREFNLSETVFVSAPRDPVNTARVRIFTPTAELPFAGHPTVGTAALLGLLRAPEILARQHLGVVLEEEIGTVDCTVRRVGGKLRASFTLPRLPSEAGTSPPDEDLAAILAIEPDAIGYAGHRPTVQSAGVPFVLVPVANRDAVARARPDLGRWDAVFRHPLPSSVYVYTNDTTSADASFHARMFSPHFGMSEDPATGSAAAALAGATALFDAHADGDHTLLIEQGFEMGRPSLITLGLEFDGGRLVSGSIGGGVVAVAQGTLL